MVRSRYSAVMSALAGLSNQARERNCEGLRRVRVVDLEVLAVLEVLADFGLDLLMQVPVG